ncbi:MAG TPA: GNAT family N-acetyltransferase [Gaiellaceae bacterium]|nr:GNAT family N-acetyltransferase [Gaiellaceae bacterium]
MAYRVRRCRTPEELIHAIRPIGHYFGWVPAVEDGERFARLIPPERMLAVLDEGRTVAGAGAYDFELTAPGPVGVPCAGVTIVGTLPTHRRRGLLGRLMRAQLDECHERGDPIAALWASEETIYGRFGYGLASLRYDMVLPRTRADLRPGAPQRVGAVRLIEADEALRMLPRLYEKARRTSPGFISRSRDWWELRRLRDEPSDRPAGAGPINIAVHELDGRIDAWALYRIAQREEDGRFKGQVRVVEAIGLDPAGTHEIWRFLLEVDLMEEITMRLLPVDTPLLQLVARPSSLSFRVNTGLWVRPVDVGAALSARGYAREGRVTFEVADAFCPWNEGTWTLADGTAKRSSRSPDLRLDVTALGTTYLGGFSFGQLVRAGVVEEVRRGAAARADAMFASSRAPWCPEIF